MAKAYSVRPLGIVTLALLVERPMHPYEMYQLLLARGQDNSVKVRPGTLYHVVSGLEESGLVAVEGVEREGNRPERTTYAITDAGRHALEAAVVALLAHPADEYPEFHVAMGEAHNLPRHTVLSLLRERVATLEQRLERGDARLAGARARGLPRRFVLGGEFALNRLRADVAWLTSVIADIDSGDLSWDAPVPAELKEHP